MLEANCRVVLPAVSPCSCPDDGGEDAHSAEQASDEVNNRETDAAPLGPSTGRSVSSDSAVVDLAVMVSAATENIIDENADLRGQRTPMAALRQRTSMAVPPSAGRCSGRSLSRCYRGRPHLQLFRSRPAGRKDTEGH
jgi:hypothetical protein